jgi:hypothetical protein
MATEERLVWEERERERERERETKKRLAREQREYTVVTALPLNRQHCERNPHRRRVLSLFLSLLHSTKLLDTTKKAMLFSSMMFSSKWENMFHVNCV